MVLIFGNSLRTLAGIIFNGSAFGICFGSHGFVTGSGNGKIATGVGTTISASLTIVPVVNVGRRSNW